MRPMLELERRREPDLTLLEPLEHSLGDGALVVQLVLEEKGLDVFVGDERPALFVGEVDPVWRARASEVSAEASRMRLRNKRETRRRQLRSPAQKTSPAATLEMDTTGSSPVASSSWP